MALNVKKLIQLLLFTTRLIIVSSTAPTRLGKENLTETCVEDHFHCGNLKIPYPFGETEICSLGPKFMITCNKSSEPYQAFLPRSNVIVRNVSLGGEMEILQPYVARECHDDRVGAREDKNQYSVWFPFFTVSEAGNELVAIGCDANATLEGFRAGERLSTSCELPCRGRDSFQRAPIPNGLENFMVSLSGARFDGSGRSCSYAFVAKRGLDFSSRDFEKDRGNEKVPMVVDWSIGDVGCDVAVKLENYSCLANNSKCVDSQTRIGYVCQCLPGFEGNPYYPDGCQVCQSDSTDSQACQNDSLFPGEPKTHNNKIHECVEIGAAVSALFLITMVLGIMWRKGYWKRTTSRETELKGLDMQTSFFTYTQIKTATNNFDPANKIGEGGFGPVYKGTLRNGTVIAVKQLSSRSRQGNREFVTEVGLISCLQHPNLVRLYGCCVHRYKLFLVYEYMENNSLARCLFEDDRLILDWPTRRKICVDVAKGLAFLHEESVLKVVHRDIKTTNILLDKDFSAKISDFGLAKLDEDEYTHISTRITGTIGYMAPEYAQWGHLTFKADVYSFGVVALEIIAGKSNIKYQRSQNCICLVDWALNMQQEGGNLIDLVDPKLGSDFDEEETVLMIKVALLCVNHSPALRPTMSEVVSMIEDRTTSVHKPNIIGDPHGKVDGQKIDKAVQRNLEEESRSLIRSSDVTFSTTSCSSSSRDLYQIV